MKLEIRTARPDDRGPIAGLIYSSSNPTYDYLHGASALDFLRYEFASGRGFAGHPWVTVALLDGEVVGTGCFYDRSVYQARANGSVKNAFGHHGWFRGLSVLSRLRKVGQVVRRPKPGELYLSNFGVAPHLRGRGIGSQLIAHKLEEARRLGYRLFGLHVSVENPRGEALYARLGLEVKRESAFLDKTVGIPPARKMELAL